LNISEDEWNTSLRQHLDASKQPNEAKLVHRCHRQGQRSKNSRRALSPVVQRATGTEQGASAALCGRLSRRGGQGR
jgi:hypothetical protein